ncbi:MAG: acylphosphatase [Gammaproteobacteria bacterium]|nr:MAG: acylphosphatase [Gammaproteobacteria bacterium]
MACMRCIVSGRVQGVFFRAHTRDEARRLGLKGWVRNLPGGEVEVVACGDENQLEALRAWLWQGPPLARVEDVACEPALDGPFEGFHIRY